MISKLIKILLLGLTCVYSQEDFFDPGHTIGGYGELHWNKSENADGDITENKLDFHRFIIFFGYNYSEKWSFKSELEIEHNMIDGSGDYDGEVELEQAFINYHAGDWGFKAGVLLASAGYINETHEPPTFLSVERPDYAIYIIPTTWFSNGFGFYGNFSGIDWKINILEDMKASGIGDGIRDARGKGYQTTAYNWIKNLRVDYNGMPGLNIGGSYIINDAPSTFNDDGTVNKSIGISLMELHGTYNNNNFISTFEYGTINYSNNDVSKGTVGYYLDVGYVISDMLNWEGRLVPWFRYSNIQKDTNMDDIDAHYDVVKLGLSYWPIDKITFKVDYGTMTFPDDENSNKTLINLGVGYMF